MQRERQRKKWEEKGERENDKLYGSEKDEVKGNEKDEVKGNENE